MKRYVNVFMISIPLFLFTHRTKISNRKELFPPKWQRYFFHIFFFLYYSLIFLLCKLIMLMRIINSFLPYFLSNVIRTILVLYPRGLFCSNNINCCIIINRHFVWYQNVSKRTTFIDLLEQKGEYHWSNDGKWIAKLLANEYTKHLFDMHIYNFEITFVEFLKKKI